ncbi:hypothetical protein PHYSODRAFT_484425 [Phytophthora sojae]|uniref:WLGC domain-containing protein n=1 Tax=Phytophthora sojae (strain P6497) TaxID=1094619 RepID=G4YS82_PHYSP|nr:hypothetical protein PHYSODRAFT_484425 [Phytophthora sojae]EGZ24783.1 hypothetical protein PHYSODRAFT_484425 [Phytophthora sojae]|eukprot:XP_009520071.1 hypothetical protein PHYSODRAFT_484425 [Phytophthora sojae]
MSVQSSKLSLPRPPVANVIVRNTPAAGGLRRTSPVSLLLLGFRRARRIAPVRGVNVAPARQENTNRPEPLRLTFFEAFGVLGVPFLTVAIICIAWTSWLVFLTLAPNEAANLLMNTGDYDNGNFWLISDRPPIVNRPKLERAQTLYGDLTGYNAKYRKFFNLCHKVSDLVVQGIVLRRILNQGLPTELTLGYAIFVCINGLSASTNILIAKNSAFVEVLIDSCYCYNNFNFDRAVYLVNAEVLSDGNFERLARTQADPAEVALFLMNFDSLRIAGFMDFVLSIGLNLSFCYRFFRVSQAACAAYPECVAFSNVWNTDNQCPCIMLIDGDRAPRTAEEWNSPKDVTHEVRALASAGLLQQLQLINRQLVHWPEELRRCTGLRSISLIYTSIADIPSWAKEFKQLEALHVEGKYGSQNLVTLPPGLFEDMPYFKFLHLGNHHNLVAIPPFDGTPNIRSVTFAILLSLTELPSFDKVPELETLLLIHIPQVVTVPDLAPLTKLSRFAPLAIRPHHFCCNGFIGSCDLTDWYCQPEPIFNVPGAECLDPNDPRRATATTKKVFAELSLSVCQKSSVPFVLEALSDFPTPERIASCSGVMYRQCEIPGVTSVNGTVGICYSSRMQVVACNVDQLFIKVRRLQTERGVGLPCDPEEEAWLGCKRDG